MLAGLRRSGRRLRLHSATCRWYLVHCTVLLLALALATVARHMREDCGDRAHRYTCIAAKGNTTTNAMLRRIVAMQPQLAPLFCALLPARAGAGSKAGGQRFVAGPLAKLPEAHQVLCCQHWPAP